MADAVLDFGAFSPAELQSMLTAAKAELLLRMTTGRVQTGGSAAQQYGMNLMDVNQLTRFINGITSALGLNNPQNLVQPNFNTRPCAINYGSLGNAFGT